MKMFRNVSNLEICRIEQLSLFNQKRKVIQDYLVELGEDKLLSVDLELSIVIFFCFAERTFCFFSSKGFLFTKIMLTNVVGEQNGIFTQMGGPIFTQLGPFCIKYIY